jgi:hypothetical protein
LPVDYGRRMPITVDPSVPEALHETSTVLLQVQSPDDPRTLTEALAAASRDIGGIVVNDAGVRYVSGAVSTLDGPLLMVDFGEDLPRETLDTVPGLIVRRLVEAGIGDAVLTVPDQMGERHDVITSFAPAARAWLCGPVGTVGDAPPRWLARVAERWLRDEHRPGAELVGLVISAETPLTWDTLPAAADAALSADAEVPVVVVSSDFMTTAAAVTVFGRFGNSQPQATLVAAGADAAPETVAGRMRRQRDVVRANAQRLAYGAVAAFDSARFLHSTHWDLSGRPDVEGLTDEVVPDGHWYQLLSPGHLARLQGVPPGAVHLEGGRVELTVGEPEQWLPGHPDRDAVRARARELVAGCLVTEAEAFTLKRARHPGGRCAPS